MRQTSFSEMHCSLARSLQPVGDWWSPLILRDLAIGPRRFDELADDLGVSRNLLTTRLGGLIDAEPTVTSALVPIGAGVRLVVRAQ